MASLEDYVLGDKLGSGTYGQVYSVTRKQDGKQFALKVISSSDRGISGLTECDLLFRLQHPNLLHGEAFILTDPQNRLHLADTYNLMLVLELALSDMDAFITPEVSLATRIRFCWECATAVKMLQDHGVHHLDIKPENVFVFGTPEEPTCKLGDFGLICYGQTTSCVLNYSGFTPTYRPPEEFMLFLGRPLLEAYPEPKNMDWEELNVDPNDLRRTLTTKSTIWSLALYFYYVLTGSNAITGEYYGGDSDKSGYVREIVEKLFTSETTRQAFLNQLPTPAAIKLIDSMLQYQPDTRPTIETVLANEFFTQAGYTQIVPGLVQESKVPTQLNRKYPIKTLTDAMLKLASTREIDRLDVFFLAVDLLYRVIDGLVGSYGANEIIPGVWIVAANCFTRLSLNAFSYIPRDKFLQLEADILRLVQGIIYRPNIYTEAWSAWSLQQLAPLINDPNLYLKMSIPAMASKLALLEPPSEKENRQSKDMKPSELKLTTPTLLGMLMGP
jgi:serine/threonine protein kinase